MSDISADVRAIYRVMMEAPLFKDLQTDRITWYARPYMNKSPEAWMAWAINILDDAARELEASKRKEWTQEP